MKVKHTLLALAAMTCAAQAAVIAVNFKGKSNTAVPGGTSPFGIDAASWVNVANTVSGSVTVGTQATLNWDAKSTWNGSGTPSTDEEYVYKGYLDDRARDNLGNAGAQIEVTGLDAEFGSGQAYKITIYGFSDNPDNDGIPEYVLNPDSIDANGITGGTSELGTLTLATGLTGRYIVTTFDNVTGDDFIVVGKQLAANKTRETISGFTVETVPEPSALALLGLGGLGLFIRRRK
jgi:hypothetical protein